MAFEALEDRIVFGINRQDADSLFGGAGGDDFPGHHENFLRCDGDVLACFDGSEGGLQAGGADDGDQDDVSFFELGEGIEAFCADMNVHSCG